jgi:cell division protein FtsB
MPRIQASSLVSKAKWPLFLMANLAVLLVVGVATIRESYRGWTVDAEIRSLEQKAQSLEGRKMQLSELAYKMQDQAFIERQARAKLGLQKPGERVVVLEGVAATQTAWQLDSVVQQTPSSDTDSNPKRWWRYFTGANQ